MSRRDEMRDERQEIEPRIKRRSNPDKTTNDTNDTNIDTTGWASGKGAARVIFLSPIFLSNMPERILNARNCVLIGGLSCQNGSRHRDAPQSAPRGHGVPAAGFRVLSPVLTSVYDGRPRCAPAAEKREGGAVSSARLFYASSNWRHGPKERWEFGGRRSGIGSRHARHSLLLARCSRSRPLRLPNRRKNQGPEDVFLVPPYSHRTPILLAFYCRPTGVLLPSCPTKPHENRRIRDVLEKEKTTAAKASYEHWEH